MKSPPGQQHLLTVRQQTENPRHDQNVESNEFDECNDFKWLVVSSELQGGRCWQPFREGKMATKVFVRHVFVCDKCDVFARNCKISNSNQYNIQYISCKSALLAQETLYLTQKSTFWPKVFQKVHKLRQLLILQQISVLRLKIFVWVKNFRRRPFVPEQICGPINQNQN